MTAPISNVWYRQPTMMLVAGVLAFTVVAGFVMLGVALQHDDALVFSDANYRDWRDQMRAIKPGAPDHDQ